MHWPKRKHPQLPLPNTLFLKSREHKNTFTETEVCEGTDRTQSDSSLLLHVNISWYACFMHNFILQLIINNFSDESTSIKRSIQNCIHDCKTIAQYRKKIYIEINISQCNFCFHKFRLLSQWNDTGSYGIKIRTNYKWPCSEMNCQNENMKTC